MNQNDSYYKKYSKYKNKYYSLKQQQGGVSQNSQTNKLNDTDLSDPTKIEKKSLYDRLGGVYAIAAVINLFSDSIIQSPLVGKDSPNPDLRKWSRDAINPASGQLDRLPGLKFMRTLWVCELTGGPFKFSATVPGACHMSLENAHEKLHISPKEFDEVARLLKESMEHYGVPNEEMNEVLTAFNAHKIEVTKGYFDKIGHPINNELICPHKKN